MELPILPLLLLLTVALLAGRVSSRFGFPSVLGELIAGILLGPPVLGWLSPVPALDVLAQLGIILMMLYIGMEIDPDEMKKASLGGFLAAIGGFITPFVMCFFLVTWLGGTPMAGAFVGMAAGVTSLATKSRILADLRLLDTRIAHVMMAGALIADTLSLIVFAGLVGLADVGTLEAGPLMVALGKAVLFFLGALVVGKTLIPFIGSKLADSGRGPAFAVVVVITLVFAEVAHLAGMHGILGAFLAGLFLRDSVLGKTLRNDVRELVKDISVRFLAPIFFVTAGFAVSLGVVADNPFLVVSVILVASVGKVIGTAGFYLLTGNGWREGLVIGASMNGRGAVEIIIAQIGLTAGLISAEIFSVLVLMAIATTATVPVFLTVGSEWLRKRGELVRTKDERDVIVIIGAGATARALAGAILPAKVALVDSNKMHCDLAEKAGLKAIHGDALDERVLAMAGCANARCCVLMTGNPEVDVLAARMAREVFLIPDVLIPDHGQDKSAHVSSLRHLGALTLITGSGDLREWDLMFDQGKVELREERIQTAGKATSVLRGFRSMGMFLPLVKKEGTLVSPLHSETMFEKGDLVVIASKSSVSMQGNPIASMLKTAPVVDVGDSVDLETFLTAISAVLAPQVDEKADAMTRWVLEREHRSSTVIDSGIAVPHVRLEGNDLFALAIARCRKGVTFPGDTQPVYAAFVIASSDDRRADHLRMLAAIARLVSGQSFLESWLKARDGEGLRTLSLERFEKQAGAQ